MYTCLAIGHVSIWSLDIYFEGTFLSCKVQSEWFWQWPGKPLSLAVACVTDMYI